MTELTQEQGISLLSGKLPIFRKIPGKSQPVFAELNDVSHSTLSGIEVGKTAMNLTIFLACIAILQDNERPGTTYAI